MKIKSAHFPRVRSLILAALLGFAVVALHPARAQNLIKNPDFEEPLGPDNWIVVFAGVPGGPTNCGPNDFLYAGRSTVAHKDMGVPNTDTWDGHPYFWSKFGGHFAPNHTWKMHAYFRQVVSNLTPNASYTISAWMTQRTSNNNYLTKCNVYLETMGGVNMNNSRRSVDVVGNCHNNPAGWQRYTVTNLASSAGAIEVRLHFNKFDPIGGRDNSYWEYRNMDAFYDHVALYPTGQSPFTPPYKILSLARSNQNLALTWETLMNSRYRIQISTNLSTWTALKRSPYLDTNFFATGTTFTFVTNLVALLAYDPSFNPNAPLYFRIASQPFVP